MAIARLNRPLLATNFFAGDVTAGFGPYLAIYLLSQLHWETGQIGIALALGTIVTVIVQTPAGAFIDWTRRKRGLLIVCAAVVGAAALMIVFSDWAPVIFAAQTLMGASLAFLGPLIAALTLGVVGREMFTRQTGANQAWNHGGNVFAAAIAAALALQGYVTGVFVLISVMVLGMIVSVLFIKSSDIDYEAARGGVAAHDDSGGDKPSGFGAVMADRRLLIFAVCIFLFHFANAAMLPLVSQKLSLAGDAASGIAFTSACIISAQFIMIGMAMLCGHTADTWGRKPLFILAFAILPIRAVLYTLTDQSVFLVLIQALDGVANGIFAIIFLLVISDVTNGTGRFNIVQGALATLVGIGASLSNLLAEQIVQLFSYDAGFFFLGAVAAAGFLVFVLFMPETAAHAISKDPTISKGGETAGDTGAAAL
ncbi:MAG: MFS transporter [Pseudomonadota bacterium]